MSEQLPIRNGYWVIPNLLLAGQYPILGTNNPLETLRQLTTLGIRTWINLVEAEEIEAIGEYQSKLEQISQSQQLPLNYHHFPIPDMEVTDQQTMSTILDQIDHSISLDQAVYIHCWAGIGRTGTVVGCYLVRHGMQPEAAIAHIAELRQNTPDRWYPAPARKIQRNMVLAWQTGQ